MRSSYVAFFFAGTDILPLCSLWLWVVLLLNLIW